MISLPTATILDLADLPTWRELPRLHVWYADTDSLQFEPMRPWWQQITRVTGSIGITHTSSDSDIAVVRELIDGTDVEVTLSLFPSRHMDPPADWQKVGREMNYLRKACERIAALELPIRTILLDAEGYRAPSVTLTAGLNLADAIVREAFPDTNILLWRNGEWPPTMDARTGYTRNAAWYVPQDPEFTELLLNRADRQLRESDRAPMGWAVWVSTGAGYWQDRWTYKMPLEPLDYYYLGRLVRGDERITDVVLYPHPLREAMLPESIPAFVSFVRGLTGKAKP